MCNFLLQLFIFQLVASQQVRVRIGNPITGYGSESRNRAARQRIPNKTWTDEDGVEHIMVSWAPTFKYLPPTTK